MRARKRKFSDDLKRLIDRGGETAVVLQNGSHETLAQTKRSEAANIAGQLEAATRATVLRT